MTNPYRAPSDKIDEEKDAEITEGQSQSRVWIGWVLLSAACFGSCGLTASANGLAELTALTLFVAGVIFAMLAVLSQTDRGRKE